MALIFRSILEVDRQDLVAAAPDLFRGWVARKIRDPELEIVVDAESRVLAGGAEVAAVSAVAEGTSVFRGRLYERRGHEEVKTTFTAIDDGTIRWGWVDLERWADDAWGWSWIPYSPGIVAQLMSVGRCYRGSTGLDGRYHVLEGSCGALLADQILDVDRQVPIVVATPTTIELEHDLSPVTERAKDLQRRLAGVAPVYVLGRGAVTAFSRAMLRAGDGMDVHSGAVRTFLPGAGGERDAPWRHRYVPYSRLARGPSDLAARLVAPPLLRAASHQAPPAAWRLVRNLPEFAAGGVRDTDLVELIDVAESDLAAAVGRAEEAERRADEAEGQLELERETQAELLAEREDLVRRLRFLESEGRKRGESVAIASSEPAFVPDFCEEVVEHARDRFDMLVLGAQVDGGAQELDQHAQPSWARKALLALEALQAYAEAKAAGAGGNFWTFCDRADSVSVVPTSWLAMAESETTDSNERFRELRTFSVDEQCSSDRSMYMPAHIKLEKGGYPSPRIHFFDDTAGPTGKIHVGWVGPHRDSKSKN